MVANFRYRLHPGAAGAFYTPVPDSPQVDMSSWLRTLRYRFLEIYVEGRVSTIDQHLREVHDWQIAQGVSPDLELDVSNDELDSLYD